MPPLPATQSSSRHKRHRKPLTPTTSHIPNAGHSQTVPQSLDCCVSGWSLQCLPTNAVSFPQKESWNVPKQPSLLALGAGGWVAWVGGGGGAHSKEQLLAHPSSWGRPVTVSAGRCESEVSNTSSSTPTSLPLPSTRLVHVQTIARLHSSYQSVCFYTMGVCVCVCVCVCVSVCMCRCSLQHVQQTQYQKKKKKRGGGGRGEGGPVKQVPGKFCFSSKHPNPVELKLSIVSTQQYNT